MTTAKQAMSAQIEGEGTLGTAIAALNAVVELCIEASEISKRTGMSQVDPDHMAALLGLILGELRKAEVGVGSLREHSRQNL